MLQFTIAVFACLYCCFLYELNAGVICFVSVFTCESILHSIRQATTLLISTIYPQFDTVRTAEWGVTWVYVEWKQPPSYQPLYIVEVIGNGINTNHKTTEDHFNVTNLKADEIYNITVQAAPQFCNLTGTHSTVSILGSTLIKTRNPKEVEIKVDPFYRGGYQNKYFIPVGWTINVSCSLTSSDYDVKDLILKPKGKTSVETSSKWRTYKLDTLAPRAFNIDCCLRKQQMDATAVLYVGYPPAQVKDFSCFSSVVKNNLVCTWWLDSDHEAQADWVAEYSKRNGQSAKGVSSKGQCAIDTTDCINLYCPCEVKQENGHFRCEVESLFSYFTYMISILGTNDFGTTIYTTSVYTDETIAKYARPEDVRVVEEGPTWLKLTWQEPHDISLLPWSRPVYNVSTSGNGQSTWFITTQRSHNVTSLKPYCNYTFAIRAKPNTSSVWSDLSVLSHRTLEDRPGVSPLLSQSGFTWWSRDSIPYLTVYWKDVPLLFRNGPLFGYSLSLICELPREDSLNSRNVTHGWTTGNSYTWRIQRRNITHRVIIRSRNRAGYSGPSTLDVPAYDASQRLLVDCVTVERVSSSRFNISWVTSPPHLLDIIVTWSLGVDPNNSTLYGWEAYPPTASYIIKKTTLGPLHSPNVSLYFGIAVRRGNQSGGITWNRCIFSDTRVDQAPAFVGISSEKAITVRFNFTYCRGDVMKSKPLTYMLVYNKQETTQPCSCDKSHVLTVPACYNVTNMTITNLDQSSTYCVCMRIVYRWGKGPLSAPVGVDLKPAPEYPWALIGGTTGGILIAIGLAIVFVVTIKKKQGKYANYLPHLQDAFGYCKLEGKARSKHDRKCDSIPGLEISESTSTDHGHFEANQCSAKVVNRVTTETCV